MALVKKVFNVRGLLIKNRHDRKRYCQNVGNASCFFKFDETNAQKNFSVKK